MSDNVYLGGNAAILQSIVDGTPYDAPIQSPIEALLLEVKEVIEAGGGGGTTNYNSLTNKPQINGEELKGDLSGAALKLLTISNTMPAAVADLEGQQLLYVGATTEDYTKGLIYECQEVTPSTSPKTYHWAAISAVSIEIDAALSTTSENPVQNKVVTLALGDKLSIAATMPAASSDLEGKQRLYVGATTLDYTKGLIYECQEVTPATDPATYEWNAISNIPIEIDTALSTTSENPVQNKVVTLALGDKISMVTTMGAASAALLGARVLYVGATDSNFTKGCIYECQEVTPETDPATYEWVVINVNDIAIDNALSSTSKNPVQNKVIWQYIYQQLYTTIANVQNNAKGAMELYSKNLNNIVTSGFYNAMQCTNAPFDYIALIVCGYYLDGYCLQIAMDVTTGAVRYRAEINNVWSAWDDLTQVDGVTITKDATTKELSAAVATALAVGVVKPDGESTSVDANGRLSVINRLIVSDTMPTAIEALEGQQRLYVGNTTATYTKGLIYECQEVTPSTDPKTYEWVAISVISVETDATPTQNSTKPVQSGGVYTALEAKQDLLTFDNTPTQNSNNPVTSGGVYTALSDKVDKVNGKGLSTNDYTTAEKNKLASLADQDARITALETALSNLNALTWGS